MVWVAQGRGGWAFSPGKPDCDWKESCVVSFFEFADSFGCVWCGQAERYVALIGLGAQHSCMYVFSTLVAFHVDLMVIINVTHSVTPPRPFVHDG